MSQASSMRVAVADAMRRSWTRPLATVGLPVELDALLAHRKTLEPKPGPAFMRCGPWRWRWRKIPRPPAAWSAARSCTPSPSTWALPWKPTTACWCPSLRGADKKPLKELTVALQRTCGTRAPAQTAAGCHGRFRGHRHQLRHVRPHLGHADSPAGTKPGVGVGRRPQDAALGRSQGPVCAGAAGVSHA